MPGKNFEELDVAPLEARRAAAMIAAKEALVGCSTELTADTLTILADVGKYPDVWLLLRLSGAQYRGVSDVPGDADVVTTAIWAAVFAVVGEPHYAWQQAVLRHRIQLWRTSCVTKEIDELNTTYGNELLERMRAAVTK